MEREITVTLKISSKHSEKQVRRLLEMTLCDTRYSHSDDEGPDQEFRIVGVDAGVNPCHVSPEPFMHDGVAYTNIVGWERS